MFSVIESDTARCVTPGAEAELRRLRIGKTLAHPLLKPLDLAGFKHSVVRGPLARYSKEFHDGSPVAQIKSQEPIPQLPWIKRKAVWPPAIRSW